MEIGEFEHEPVVGGRPCVRCGRPGDNIIEREPNLIACDDCLTVVAAGLLVKATPVERAQLVDAVDAWKQRNDGG